MAHLAHIAASAALLLVLSCSVPDTGSQLGKFSGDGGGGLASLASPNGGWPATISAIWGHRLSPAGYVEGEKQNLLYIVTGYPGANCSGSEGSDGQFVSTRSCTWKTGTESFTMSLSWDRRTDVVTAGGQKFRPGR